MSMIFDISIVTLVFFIFLFFDSISSTAGNIFVFTFFAFILANLGESVTKLAIFYLILTLFNLIMGLTAFKPNVDNKPQGLTLQIFNSPIPLLQLGGGILLLVVFAFLSTGAKNSVFGIPALASTVNILSPVFSGFNLAAIALLGIAENRTAVILTNLVSTVQPFGYALAIPAIAIFFGLFHAAAYSATGIASLIFPMLSFGIIIASVIVLKEDVIANTSHYWYNALIQISRGLIIRP